MTTTPGTPIRKKLIGKVVISERVKTALVVIASRGEKVERQ